MKDPREIVRTAQARKSERGPLVQRQREIAQNYDADIVVPLPDLNKTQASAIANFFAQGIDQHAMRVASVMPDIDYPTLKPGQRTSIEQARTRRRASLSFWQRNQMDALLIPKRARHLIAYAASGVMIGPDRALGCPKWQAISPMDMYPSDDGMRPDDMIRCYTKPAAWLRQRYPDALNFINANMAGRRATKIRDEDMVEIIEYCDADQRTLIATGDGQVRVGLTVEAEYGVGDAKITNLGMGGGRHQWIATLEDTPNRAGLPLAIVAERISLNAPKGQFDDARALAVMMARLMALDVHAVTNSVFPDVWFVHDGNGRIIQEADGLTGTIGEVEQGQIAPLNAQPGFQTGPTLDRLERNIRLNTAQPAELGGESGTNIRTDRRGQSILSAAIDFYVQEHQKILAESLRLENETAAEVDRAYGGRRKASFYVNFNKDKGQLDYRPADLWEGPHPQFVEYAMVGMDANDLIVMSGQQLSLKLISRLTSRKQMPNIGDPEFEERQTIAEALDDAALGGLQTQIAQGQFAFTDVIAIKKAVMAGKSLEEAVEAAQQAAQERQATPVEPQAPEAQPGIEQPGIGAEQPTVAPPSQSLEDLHDILGVSGRVRSAANA